MRNDEEAMNERKKMTMISVLEVVEEASPWAVSEEILVARCTLRPPKPTATEVAMACVELEQKHKAISRDVAPVTETVRFASTANAPAILRALREG